MSAFIEYVQPFWRNLDMRKLKVDEAYIVLKSFYNKTIYLYTLSEDCFSCPFSKVHELNENNIANVTHTKSKLLSVNVAKSLKLKITDIDYGKLSFENQTALCSLDTLDDMREFGVYNLTIERNGTCSWQTDKEGVNTLYSLLSIFLLCLILWAGVKAVSIYIKNQQTNSSTETANEAETTDVPRERLQSLDAFRGLSIVLMIFVNSGGGGYWWIEHAPWNGLHLADLVFPSFIWISGVCIPISIKSQLRNNVPRIDICKRIFSRCVKLFLIGFCLNSLNGPNLEDIRIMGVLQRFGVAILICGVIHAMFTKTEYIMPQNWAKRCVYDLILLKKEIFCVFFLIAAYICTVFYFQVPGCPRGYLGPGGKHQQALHWNCTGGAIGYIDENILGKNHIYQHGTAKKIFESNAFDPEGLVGCLLTTVQAFLGLHAGFIILVYQCKWARAKRWLLSCFILLLIGGLLCSFQKENGLIPVNKNLWSLSFVLVTSGMAYFIQSVVFFLMDVQKWISGTPLVECGQNAIILYVGHTIMHKMLPWHWRIGEMNTHFVLLMESLWNTFLWVQIALFLNKKKIYFKI